MTPSMPAIQMLAMNMPPASQLITSAVLLICSAGAVALGYAPLRAIILKREEEYNHVLRNTLLLDISGRTVTVLTAVEMLLLGLVGVTISPTLPGFLIPAAVGVIMPPVLLRFLKQRRLRRLEAQLVESIVTLASGVRAGLNLVQAMGLVARDAPPPISQEFAHMMREYEYGIPLEEAMSNAATRIGSGDFRLLFSALQTHRERGGDLGETLDRIADSIREIQRLEKRVQTLTAQGRATARWLGAMPILVAGLYYIIDPDSVSALFNQSLGNIILLAVIVLDILGFVWIKKIVNIDV